MKEMIQESKLINKKSGLFVNCFLHVVFFTILLLIPRISSAQNILNNADCVLCQEVQTYPQLASVDTDEGRLTEHILGQLLGSQLNLTALNWQGVAQGDVGLLEFINTLQSVHGISSPEAVLNTEFTLLELSNALIIVGANDGTLALLNSISAMALPGEIKLADLLSANVINGDLADMDLNMLTFVTGLVQLYNYKNVAVTNAPVTVDLGALGLGTAALTAQVVEPPHLGCGDTGDKFFSAGIRLKLDVNLVNQVILETEVTVGVWPLDVDADVKVTLEKITLYIDVARGEVTLKSVNSDTRVSTFDVQPGLARIFIGNIQTADFFDRTKDPADYIEDGRFGSVNVKLPLVSAINLDLNIEAAGDATPGVVTVSETVPFETVVGSSSTVLATLLSELSTSSLITITSSTSILGNLLDVVNLITGQVTSVANNLLFSNTGIVYNLLANVVDPLLKATGVGIGQVYIKSDNIHENCYDYGDAPTTFGTTLVQDGPRHLINGPLYLGPNEPSAKPDGTPGDNADLDANDDGLESYEQTATNNQYSVEVNYNNSKSDSAMIVAWIDFNGDGIFDNETERSVITPSKNAPPNSSGKVVLTWDNAPSNWAVTSNILRVRISSDPNLADANRNNSKGFLNDGEVEDYLLEASILDVNLVDFNVQNATNNVLLKWETNSEINLSGYSIEKSENGRQFETIGWVNANNNVSIENSYTYSDKLNVNERLVYYRLKMVDLDNTFEYSQTKSITIKVGAAQNEIDVFPNPISSDSELTINTTNVTQSLKIFDINNSKIQEIQVNNRLKFTVPVNHLKIGIYILQFTDSSGETINKRIVII